MCFLTAALTGDLEQLQPDESGLGWQQILALRLLYSVLSPDFHRAGYADFLRSAGALRERLTPCDVAAFVRQQAGFNEGEKLLMVWVFDEAQAFEAAPQPTDSGPKVAELLSAFVDF